MGGRGQLPVLERLPVLHRGPRRGAGERGGQVRCPAVPGRLDGVPGELMAGRSALPRLEEGRRVSLPAAHVFPRERSRRAGRRPFPRRPLLPEELVFYDTETTGLSGGAGNVIFLFGAAWCEGRDLAVEQLFLSDFPGEPEFLQAVQDLVRPYRPGSPTMERHSTATCWRPVSS